MARPFRVRNQLVNGLLGEELAGQKGLLKRDASNGPGKTAMRRRSARRRLYAVIKCLALGRAASHFLHLGLFGAARVFAGLLGRLLFARRAL
jgi:hypothetical protein